MNKKILSNIVILSTLLLFSACSSHDVLIAPKAPKEYKVLGKAKGQSSGSLGILATAYNFIPMGLNTRVEKAYDNAVKSVDGATGLINVTYQEDWYWWFIGTARSVTIEGDAIREIK